MNEEDRGLIRRALDALSGQGSDPARQGLEQLISEHGREAVAKASADLLPQGEGETTNEPSDEELARLLADVEDPYEQRFKALEEKLDKLGGVKAEGESGESGDNDAPLPQDELELVKSGVPVEQIEEARPMLRSQDEQARQAAFAFLAKQADPSRRALLAKERGSSQIPADDDVAKDYVARLAKADGEQPADDDFTQELVRRLGSRG